MGIWYAAKQQELLQQECMNAFEPCKEKMNLLRIYKLALELQKIGVIKHDPGIRRNW